MNVLDKMQQAWQSQRCAMPPIDPGSLLKQVRLERQARFWCDMFIILVLIGVGAQMSWFAFRDIEKYWPWLISVVSDAWVVAFILFNRRRRRCDVGHYDQTMLAHVERSIEELENRMRMDRYSLWWYVLPIALGCMIPPVLFFAMDYGKAHKGGDVFLLLSVLGVFLGVFVVVHRAIQYGVRKGLAGRNRELQALRSLRESLLSMEE